MRLILFFFNFSITFCVISGSFVNPYPRFKSFHDGGDPGDALYLTKYIESGDIETVNYPHSSRIKPIFSMKSIETQKIKIMYNFRHVICL